MNEPKWWKELLEQEWAGERDTRLKIICFIPLNEIEQNFEFLFNNIDVESSTALALLSRLSPEHIKKHLKFLVECLKSDKKTLSNQALIFMSKVKCGVEISVFLEKYFS